MTSVDLTLTMALMQCTSMYTVFQKKTGTPSSYR